MPRRSRWSVNIPKTSIPTYVFGSQTAEVPDDLAFADADCPDTLFFTVSSYREWSKRFAAGLIAAGLQPRGRVVISSVNSVFYPIVHMGVLMADGVYSSANAQFVARELGQQLSDSEATFMLVSEANLQTGLKAASMAGMSRERIYIFNDAPLERPGGGQDNEKEGESIGSILLHRLISAGGLPGRN
jgi:4-coumarate--CoA ligase